MGYDYSWYIGIRGECLFVYTHFFAIIRPNWNAAVCNISNDVRGLPYIFHSFSLTRRLWDEGFVVIMADFRAGIDGKARYTG